MHPVERYARSLEALELAGLSPTEAVQTLEEFMAANDRQVGGDHYKKGGEEHWDRAWRLKYDPFQYIITKWIERWREKGGVDDLRKAQHAIEKYIEVASVQEVRGAPATLTQLLPELIKVDLDHGASVVGAEKDIAEWLRAVKPTGWTGFVFEGADALGYLYTCSKCRANVRVPQFVPPHSLHTHNDVDTGEPGPGYVNQD